MNESRQFPTVAEAWRRIDACLAEHAPQIAENLAKGAAATAFGALENQLSIAAARAQLDIHYGFELPEEFRQSYALHNGQNDPPLELVPIDDDWYYLLSLAEIAEEYAAWNDVQKLGDFDELEAAPDEGIASMWWHPQWVPFASNGNGDNLCLDLAPAKGGTVGQVILVLHSDERRALVASSLAEWLTMFAEELEEEAADDDDSAEE